MKINMDTIIQDPNPVLRAQAKPVPLPLSDEDRETLMTMLQYVRDSQDEALAEANNLQPAVGIAAPQIGVSKQMSAIRLVDYNDDDEEIVSEYALVNPRIISHSEKKCALSLGEGCLSIREEHAGFVPRHLRVKVKAYDALLDKEIVIQLSNYASIVFQHEIDHLHGVLFYDTINTENPWDDSNLKIIE
ncbi:peptide deformylase [Erysipelothrix larvae]|uniref:Peptide deformylase n=1 Tax=Erysipelothrix larvae TaxID=1514105 RepID=A0A0X8H2A4_9FIRM|nr:peptide deformylase [Erysipelothrix larvae]AMC94639.1 peptide deformylase [Erysipelothrix larvae]